MDVSGLLRRWDQSFRRGIERRHLHAAHYAPPITEHISFREHFAPVLARPRDAFRPATKLQSGRWLERRRDNVGAELHEPALRGEPPEASGHRLLPACLAVDGG